MTDQFPVAGLMGVSAPSDGGPLAYFLDHGRGSLQANIGVGLCRLVYKPMSSIDPPGVKSTCRLTPQGYRASYGVVRN